MKFATQQRTRSADILNGLLPRWLLVFAFLLALSPRLLASEIVVTFAQDKLKGDVKSFEISVNGVSPLLIGARADGFTVKKLGTQKGGDFRLEVTKTNGTIADGDKIILKISGQDAPNVAPLAPIWYDDKGKLMGTSDNTKVKVNK